MKSKYLILSVLLLLPLLASAQDAISIGQEDEPDDFRSRISASVGGDIGRYLSWKVSEEIRVKDSFRRFDRFYTSATLEYKALRWLKIAPEYTLINLLDVDTKSDGSVEKEWETRHRVALNITGTLKVGGWKFSLRERPQVMIRCDSINFMEKNKAAFVLRSRAKASYTFRKAPLTPYVFVEMTNTLNTPKEFSGYALDGSIKADFKLKNYISKMRYSAGVEIHINSHNKFDINYKLDDVTDYDINISKKNGYLKSVTRIDSIHHILCVGYSYSF